MNAIDASRIHPLVALLGWVLVHSAWQIAALALAAALILRSLRGRSANARYLAACLAMTLMAASPILTLAILNARSRDAGEPQSQTTIQFASVPPGERTALPQEQPSTREKAEEPSWIMGFSTVIDRPSLSSRFEEWIPAMVTFWCLGVAVISLRLLGGWVVLQRLARVGTRPVGGDWETAMRSLGDRLGIRSRTMLKSSERVPVPMVVGWWRPVILLPASVLTGLPSDQLALILGHELAHIRRHDYLVNLAQCVVETLLFHHPCIWWISRVIRDERENCCDDQAIALCDDRLDYARALASLEAIRSLPPRLAPSARGGPLLWRIKRILGVAPLEESRAKGLAGTFVLALLTFAGLTLVIAPSARPTLADDAPKRIITGTVKSPNGKPVAGADVWMVAAAMPSTNLVELGQGKTDDLGRFQIPWDENVHQTKGHLPPTIWAYHPTHGLGRTVLNPPLEWPNTLQELGGNDPDRPITLTLSTLAEIPLRVLDDEGEFAKGVKVVAVRFEGDTSRAITIPPAALRDRLSGTTDDHGAVNLLVPKDWTAIEIQVEREGRITQGFTKSGGFMVGDKVRLAKSVRLDGRVTADDPSVVQGIEIWILAYIATQDRSIHSTSTLKVITDQEGRFTSDWIANPRTEVLIDLPTGSRYQQFQPFYEDQGNNSAKITIPLDRATEVRGQVVEKGTKRPVPNAIVVLASRRGASPYRETIRTDESGRFLAHTPPDLEIVCHLQVPHGYLRSSQGIMLPKITTEGQELPVIEIEKGISVPGVVQDEQGRPVEGAKVVARWEQIVSTPETRPGSGPFLGISYDSAARSNAQGAFTLDGVHPDAEIEVEAQAGEERTSTPLKAKVDTKEPIRLVVGDANIVALKGRVVDSDGVPAAGTLVKIEMMKVDSQFVEPGKPSLDGHEIRTDKEGRFVTPRLINRGFRYRAQVPVTPLGLMSDASPWLTLGPKTTPELANVVLRKLRSVEGRVFDTKGNPVPGATVRQAGDGPSITETKTDENGHYRLAGIVAEPAFLFASKENYRFTGRSIRARESEADLTLEPESDPPPGPLTSKPPMLSREPEIKLLNERFVQHLERITRAGEPNRYSEAFSILTRIDPERAREIILKRDPAWKIDPDATCAEVAGELAGKKFEEAVKMVADSSKPEYRFYGTCALAGGLPQAEKDRKRKLLDDARQILNTIGKTESQISNLIHLARLYEETGEPNVSLEVLREAEAIARTLDTKGWPTTTRSFVARGLAAYDLPAALSLIKGCENEEFYPQWLGLLAAQAAGHDAAEAERVLLMIPRNRRQHADRFMQRICHRMAKIDRDRATNLARTFCENVNDKAQALAGVALAIVETNEERQEAVRLLNEAFTLLEDANRSDHDMWNGLTVACTTAAGLLPIVERVDPTLLIPCIWRTLAMRPALRPEGDPREQIPLIADLRVAAMIARYDRRVARQILDSFIQTDLPRFADMNEYESFTMETLMQAATYISPYQAASMIGKISEMPSEGRANWQDQARLIVAGILSRPSGELRWKRLERTFLHILPLDQDEVY